METKHYASKQLRGHWSNQRGNQNIPGNKWQWKRNNWTPMGWSKSSAKGKFVAAQANFKKQKNHQINNRALHLKQQEREQKASKVSRLWIINHKMRAEIRRRRPQHRSIKPKHWFFEKINKIDKPLARLIKEKKGEDSNQ